MTIKDKIVRNTIIVCLSNFTMMAAGFLLLPFMVARLGMEVYGLIAYTKLFSILGFISVFDFGLRKTTAKFVAQHQTEGNWESIYDLLISASWFLLIVGFSLAITANMLKGWFVQLLGIPDVFTHTFTIILQITFFTYIVELPGLTFCGALEGFQKFSGLKGVEVGHFLMSAISSVVLILLGYGFFEIALSNILISLIKLLAILYLVWNCLRGKVNSRQLALWTTLKKYSRFSRQIFSSQLSSLIANQGEKFIIAILLPPTMMTMYEVLIKLPRLVKSYFSFGTIAIMPAASELSVSSDRRRARQLFDIGLRFNLMVVSPIVFCVIYFAKDFLLLWMGKDFVNLTLLLQVLILFNLLNPLSSYGIQILMGMNLQLHWLPRIQWINTSIKFVVWFTIIPLLGLWGIVIGYFSTLFTLFVSIHLPCQELEHSSKTILFYFLKIIAAAAFPAILFTYMINNVEFNSYPMLFIAGTTWLSLSWLLFYFFVMERNMQKLFTDLFHKLAILR